MLFHKEYTPYALILFLDKHESAKPHILPMQWKVVDNIFLFYQKKAQTQVLAGTVREFFQLLFWGILPSFSAYAAFLFITVSSPESPPEENKAITNFKPADGERWEMKSSFMVNAQVLFKK